MPVNRFGQELPAYDASASIGGDPVVTTDLTGDQSALNPSGVPDGYVPVSQGNGTWAWEPQSGSSGGSGTDPGALRAANNLSDLGNAATARTNLGLGTAATQPSTAFEPAGAIATALAGLGSTVDWKSSVRAATTANITLSGTQTVDGIALSVGDRVLVKDQSAGAANGIYVVAAGTWTRALDADALAEVTPGLCTAVEQGSTNGGRLFVLTTPAPITLDTTALTFTAVSGAGGLLPANNLSDLASASTARANLGLTTFASIPVQAGNTTQFLRADGTVGTPPGGGAGGNVENVVLFFPLTSEASGVAAPSASTTTPILSRRLPYGIQLTTVRLTCTEAPTGSEGVTVDVHFGTPLTNSSILTTRPVIEPNRFSSLESVVAPQPVVSNPNLPNDGHLFFYVDQTNSAVRGLGIYLYGVRQDLVPATNPAAPTGLAVAGGDGQNVLTWTAPSSLGTVLGGAAANLVRYVIEWGSGSGSDFPNTINDDALTGFTHTGLTNGTTYRYRVRAFNSANLTSVASTSATGTPLAPGTPPSAPGGVFASGSGTLDNGTATLFWTGSSSGSPTEYALQYRLGPNTTDAWIDWPVRILAASIGAWTFNFPSAVVGTYNVRVAGVNASGIGTWSTSNNLSSTRTSPLAAPVIAGTATGTTVNVTWDAISGATQYILQWRVGPTDPWGTVYVGPTPSFAHTGRPTGTNRYRAFAFSGVNGSATSNLISVTV